MTPTPPATSIFWRIKLFDGPVLVASDGEEIRHFRSHKVAALLAYLALNLGRPCPREELCAALWPDEIDPQVLSNRLRVTLASLRRNLEPPGATFGSVLDVKDAGRVRLRAESVWCDAVAAEHALKGGRAEDAAALVSGPFLPGFYDDWAVLEQERWELLHQDMQPIPAPHAPEVHPLSFRYLHATATPYQGDDEPAAQLPLYLTRFFGREVEISNLMLLLEQSRLVSVLGSGGIGKTRLAAETVRRVSLPVPWVSLSDISEEQHLPAALLRALNRTPSVDQDLVDQAVEALLSRETSLLVLDNAEHLLEPVAALSMRLLQTVPRLRLLVTSRQRLEVPGEVLFELDPLVPPRENTQLDQLHTFPSAALFLDRAKNARPDFTLTNRNRDALISICRQLEGVPLALELAAARITAQSPSHIAEALAVSLLDLKSRQRGLPKRHRTLRAAIQSSVDLLPPELHRFFACLSSFRGGLTAHAAAFVTCCPSPAEFLEDLAIRSLIVVREGEEEGDVRYSLLESLRQFAAETFSPGEQDKAIQRHAEYYLSLAANVFEDDANSLRPLDREHENLLLALDYGRRLVRGTTFWQGLTGALIYAFVRGQHRIALQWLDANIEESVTITDPVVRRGFLWAAFLILPDVGRLKATERIAAMMEAAPDGGPLNIAYAYCMRGHVAECNGEMEQAVRLLREALEMARALQDRALVQACLAHASGALHGLGAHLGLESQGGQAALKEAEDLARELLAIAPPESRRSPLARLLLAVALWFQRRVPEAYYYLKAAQQTSMSLGTTGIMIYALVYESEIACAYGNWEHAARAYGAYTALQERMGYSLARAQSARPAWIEKLSIQLEDRLGTEHFTSLTQQGRQTPLSVLAAESLPI